ncbi:MAG: hypothetical protein NTX80_02745 [Candidatus Saccharibacteria bacterium]|nr:hypothetical protein [Candidatus Saccharibacteria bacterium]
MSELNDGMLFRSYSQFDATPPAGIDMSRHITDRLRESDPRLNDAYMRRLAQLGIETEVKVMPDQEIR